MRSVLLCLEECFNDFEDNPLFSSCSIFDPSSWLSESDPDSNIQDFGNDKLKFLVEHFSMVLESQGCKLESVQHEWGDMKVYVTKHQHLLNLTYTQFWQQFFFFFFFFFAEDLQTQNHVL